MSAGAKMATDRAELDIVIVGRATGVAAVDGAARSGWRLVVRLVRTIGTNGLDASLGHSVAGLQRSVPDELDGPSW
jgi:hypothetical protein